MLSNITRVMILSLCFITTSSCSTQTSSLRSNPTTRTKIIEIQTGSNVEEQLLEALIRAKPGTVIQLGEGMFEFTQTLSL
ncbi:MAG TPA: hypothetical protein PKD72_01500, partial [Gemmatales bacterium]|nr:hypothetical protein [Gemmatales bacterium]